MAPSLKSLSLCVLFVALLLARVSCDCFGVDCKVNLQQKNKYTLSEIVNAIDSEIRRVYWYYLNGAIQIFQTNVDLLGNETMHYFIYRNKQGTFLVVVSKKKASLDVSVNTFVKIGSGFTKDVVSSSPVAIEPFIISIKLNPNELILDSTSYDRLNQQMTSLANVWLSEQKINKMDNYVRSNYWQYLSQGYLMTPSWVITSEKTSAVFNYINSTGTYLVMAEMDNKSQTIKINTFVRLGAGSITNEIKPINLAPKLISAA